MVLILDNKDIQSVLDMPSCIDVLYEGLKAYARGDAARRPRIDLFAPTSRSDEFSCFSSMEGIIRSRYYAIRIKPDIVAWPELNGLKRRVTYCSRPGLYGGIVLLFSAENAELVGIMNDGHLQHMRVGATAALGARYLARSNAETVGVLGSGRMARSLALGFSVVRKLRTIKAYSPSVDHLSAYCDEMRRSLDIEVVPVRSPSDAIRGSDIVACCTNSVSPVLEGRWLEPGMHVTHVSNRELGTGVLERVTLVGYLVFGEDPLDISRFADHNFEIRAGTMAYVAGQPEERQRIPAGAQKFDMPNARWHPCVDWQTERPAGRNSETDISLLAELSATFPLGLASSSLQGIQFAAVAGLAYERAAARSLGRSLDLDLFLQDIPT